ncbi:hypothetical protein LSTR_LSTR000165 [Laodelphax striatellus]|uniref:Uncharacterized protein n=1 Tax=Laodelphax striatellus TaxID=195883 RepID=A0A482X814_LAOST|nr:hypothetical protein LSTR_LSTR000165 [Laodelphax striatellus]
MSEYVGGYKSVVRIKGKASHVNGRQCSHLARLSFVVGDDGKGSGEKEAIVKKREEDSYAAASRGYGVGAGTATGRDGTGWSAVRLLGRFAVGNLSCLLHHLTKRERSNSEEKRRGLLRSRIERLWSRGRDRDGTGRDGMVGRETVGSLRGG